MKRNLYLICLLAIAMSVSAGSAEDLFSAAVEGWAKSIEAVIAIGYRIIPSVTILLVSSFLYKTTGIQRLYTSMCR